MDIRRIDSGDRNDDVKMTWCGVRLNSMHDYLWYGDGVELVSAITPDAHCWRRDDVISQNNHHGSWAFVPQKSCSEMPFRIS